jgi:uncharacterized membrane protein
MKSQKNIIRILCFALLLFFPFILGAQHPEPAAPAAEEHKPFPFEFIFEYLEVAADIVGIAILLIGFAKGVYMFIRLEMDRLLGKKDYEEIFSLRNILGTYIIISLDFLIVSDIIHSVISPETEELMNLGIIVVLRTSIGFFLGKELNELRKELKEEAHEAEVKEKEAH